MHFLCLSYICVCVCVRVSVCVETLTEQKSSCDCPTAHAVQLTTTCVWQKQNSTLILAGMEEAGRAQWCMRVCMAAETHDLSTPQMACPDVSLPQTHVQHGPDQDCALLFSLAFPLFSLLSLPVFTAMQFSSLTLHIILKLFIHIHLH